MKDSYNIFKILMIFIIFIVLGYFISFRVTSFSSFTFIIWVVFVIIVIFLYLVFFKLEAGISDKLKNLESLLKHKDSLEETGKSSYSDTNSSLESIEPDIISITAHEIKTPVSIIKGYTDLLLNDSEFSAGINDKAREYIKRIDSSSNEIFSLVENFLNATKIENNKLSLNLEKFNIVDLVGDIVDNMENEASIKKQHILIKKMKNIPMISADKLKIEEVINNLIENAINYSPEGADITVLINFDAKFVEVAVKDTGFGISYNDQKRIFSKFFRSDNVNIRKVGGTGLGLYISSKIIDMHHGNISVTSNENEGSTFSFKLPINV